MRVYINQFYETVPDESQFDNYCPKKGRIGHTDVATKITHKISHQAAVSTRSGLFGVAGNVLSKITDLAKPFLPAVMGAAVSSLGFGPAAAGVVSGMMGMGYKK